MTFQPRPTATGDTLSASRDQIRTNFQVLRDVIQQNHEGNDQLNDVNVGKHKFLQMPEQAGAPAVLANEMALYAKEATNANLFAESEGGVEYQMTTMTTATDAISNRFGTKVNDPTAGQDGGFTFLPGGLVMAYGRADHGTVAGTVTFPIQFNGKPFSITTTVESNFNTNSFHITTITNSTFTYAFQGGGPTSIQYMAIGVIN